jgi:hypothetical protein
MQWFYSVALRRADDTRHTHRCTSILPDPIYMVVSVMKHALGSILGSRIPTEWAHRGQSRIREPMIGPGGMAAYSA